MAPLLGYLSQSEKPFEIKLPLKRNIEHYDNIRMQRHLGAILEPLEKHSGDTGQKMYFSH